LGICDVIADGELDRRRVGNNFQKVKFNHLQFELELQKIQKKGKRLSDITPVPKRPNARVESETPSESTYHIE